MSNQHFSRMHVAFTVVVIVSLLLQSCQWPPWQTPTATTVPSTSQPPTATPTPVTPGPPTATPIPPVGANTLAITNVGFSPDMIQVEAGQSISITNLDSRTRTISTAGPLESSEPEVLTLAAGESIDRTYDSTGNITLTDNESLEIKATILITSPALATEGVVEGTIIDFETKAPIAGAQVRVLDQPGFEATTDANGLYRLSLPGGQYLLVLLASGYSFANREVSVQSYTPVRIEQIELVPLDTNVVSIGGAGGVAINEDETTNVIFEAGAVSSTKAIRLTVLPVNAETGDFSALPGPFTDGNMPIGFVKFEPDGTPFNGPVTWTIDYNGDLPVGTYTPCYYWIEDEARWGEPVDGYVVDLGNDKKGLRAVLPHFSAYGFAPPPPPIPDAPQLRAEEGSPEDNTAAPDNMCSLGSQLNLMSGELCQTVGTLSLPNIGALPTQITAHYYSLDMANKIVISADIGPSSGELTPEATWTFEIAGSTFSGAGKQPFVEWDGRDNHGVKMPPGEHVGTLTANWKYDYTYQDCNNGCQNVHMISYYSKSTPWAVQLKRNDLSAWGLGWFSPHDMLLVERGDTVSFIEGDGRQVSFIHEDNDTYSSPKGDFSMLAKLPDGSWTRTYQNGDVLTFNADGRLTRIADRYDNSQSILYESNGVTVPSGSWGLTTRIRRVFDSSGNKWDYAYNSDGWLESITDSAGRVLELTHDAQGHLLTVTDLLGQDEEFGYDGNGFMNRHTDLRNFETTYELDERGRVVKRTWPTGTNLTVTYEDLKVNLVTDRGTPIETTMDENFSPIQHYNGVYTMTTTYNDDLLPASSDAPPQQTFYDGQGNVVHSFTSGHVALEHDAPFQQISQLTANDGTDTGFQYDATGNLQRVTDALGQEYRMTYDEHGQLRSITDPLNHVTALSRNARGQVERITDPLNRTFVYTYDAAGNRRTIQDPLGRTTRMEYDVLDRLTRVIDALDGEVKFEYDANGNLLSVTDPTSRAIEYTYDELNRMESMTYPGGGETRYGYDGSGNLISLTDPRDITTTLTYDDANRPKDKIVGGGPTVNYTFDDFDQLLSVNDGTLTQTFEYQPDTSGYPLRVQQEAVPTDLPLDVTVEYQYSGGQVLPPGSTPITVAQAADTVASDPALVSLPSDHASPPVSILEAETPILGSAEDVLPPAMQFASFIARDEHQNLVEATCTSTAGGNWSDSGIWDCGVVPGETDAAIIDGETVTLDIPVTVLNLTLRGGTLQGSSPVTVTGAMEFTSGRLVGSSPVDTLTIAENATLTISNNGGPFQVAVVEKRTLTNLGNTSIAGAFSLRNEAVFNNSGTVILDTVLMNTGGSGTGTFNNSGILTLSASTSVADIDAQLSFNNAGTVNVNAGTLRLGASGTDTGHYVVATGTSLQFTGIYSTMRTLTETSSITGGGDIFFIRAVGQNSGGTITIGGMYAVTGSTTIQTGIDDFSMSNNGIITFDTTSGSVIFPILKLGGGVLRGSSQMTVTGTMQFTGGMLAGTSPTETLTIASGGTLTFLPEPASRQLNIINRTLSNLGTTNITGMIRLRDGAVINNAGTATLGTSRMFTGGSGNATLNNSGTLNVSAGTGAAEIQSQIDSQLTFTNTGSVDINSGTFLLGAVFLPTSGEINLNGGNLQRNSTLTMDGGIVRGNGTILANVVSRAATLAPDGELNITGNYVQASDGKLNIKVGGTTPGTTYDVLNISGSASLDGTLNITLVDGFVPQVIQTFDLITFGSHTAEFDSVQNPSAGTHPLMYASNSVRLGVFEPDFVLPGDGRLSGVSLTSKNNTPQTLALTYDAVGQLKTLQSAGFSSYNLIYSYDAASRLMGRNASDGSVPAYAYTYDNADQLKKITISNAGSTAQLLALDYTYDDAGNIAGLTSSRDGGATYTYDALNQLQSVSSPGFNAVYEYDAAGNRTKAGNITFNYDEGGRLESSSDGASYTYDVADNLWTRTRGGQTDTFTWDGQGRLTRIDYADDTFSEYQYDDQGRRISKRGRDGTTIYYTYLGLNLAQELDSSGAVIASYTYDGLDRPISMWRDGQTFFYLLDHLGSVLGLVDENGELVATYRYDPWGNIIDDTGSITNPLRFNAREWDEESGLYLYRTRYYDPQVGRFIVPDRIVMIGAYDLFIYVNNNPTKLGDPLGLAPNDKTFGLPRDFWNWYHDQVKEKGDPDLDGPEAREWFAEWKRQGKPNSEGTRTCPDDNESPFSFIPDWEREKIAKVIVVAGAVIVVVGVVVIVVVQPELIPVLAATIPLVVSETSEGKR
jgi:RHS repeat-associated protein